MIAPARIALLKDSYYQVMDNWVFRILAVICGVFVLIPFMVGFQENGIVIGFGLLEWSYEEVMEIFGGAGDTGFQSADIREQAIALYMELIVQKVVGNMGVLFSIAATAFFVPQMLEKGAADVLLHKPLGRLSFYLSRYFSGVLFVSILSSVLALGTYVGFLVSSGHNDPGILMGAPLMTYVFALIFSVAMLVGVFTRSTVASILLTCIFFVLNGCVDTAWVGITEIELQLERSGMSSMDEFSQAGQDSNEQTEANAAVQDEEESQSSELEEEEHPIRDFLWDTLSVVHYMLPKTGDADVIAKKLRRKINAPPFREEVSRLALSHMPEGMQIREAAEGSAPAELSSAEVLLLGESRLFFETIEEPHALRYTLFRRPAIKTERTSRKGRTYSTTENASKASKEFQKLLLERLPPAPLDEDGEATEGVVRKSTRLGSRGPNGIAGYALSWTNATGQGRRAVLFRVGQEWIYTLVIEDEAPEQSADRSNEVFQRVSKEIGYDITVGAYEEAFTFTSPWRFNILFSVGSSLAFVLLMLFFGWWKLTRIDF